MPESSGYAGARSAAERLTRLNDSVAEVQPYYDGLTKRRGRGCSMRLLYQEVVDGAAGFREFWDASYARLDAMPERKA